MKLLVSYTYSQSGLNYFGDIIVNVRELNIGSIDWIKDQIRASLFRAEYLTVHILNIIKLT